MAQVYQRAEIQAALRSIDVVAAIEEGFVAYSKGRAVVPPVGELVFDEPPGDVHIKYGYLRNDEFFVIKIASGFYENARLGLPTGDGLMLLFSQKTGRLLSVLLDGGWLTDVRTAAAGAVAARYLAPSKVERIGILGTGVQGRMQLEHLFQVVACREVLAWGRSRESLDAYRAAVEPLGVRLETTLEAGEVAARCNLIVTATPAKAPLLRASQIRPGTHITAVGADTAEKNELDPAILGRAEVVVADSLEQCRLRGEIHHAIEAGLLEVGRVRELGQAIVDPALRRTSDAEISVADLTGVAVQDIQISRAVYQVLASRSGADALERGASE